MSREIKFRAWDNYSKSFIEDDEYLIGLNGKFYRMDFYSGIENYEDGNLIWNELDNITLSQFTGLLDKNGKEIYEGDLLKRFGETKILICDGKEIYSPHCEISKAVFVEGCFQVVILAQKNSYFGKIPSNPRIFFKPDVYLEVIGNIYQNPELLGGENG